jgi:hypothetical protein
MRYISYSVISLFVLVGIKIGASGNKNIIGSDATQNTTGNNISNDITTGGDIDPLAPWWINEPQTPKLGLVGRIIYKALFKPYLHDDNYFEASQRDADND